MPRRAADTVGTFQSPDHVAGSDFKQKSPLKIPLGLDPSIRKRVKSIVEENPYLEQAQMAAIVRLAKLYEHFDKIEDQVNEEGYTRVNRFGDTRMNPAAEALTRMQNAIVTQERNLAISVPTRNEQIAKKDRAPVGRPKSAASKKTPSLRLA